MYKFVFRRVFFLFSPESIHGFVILILKIIRVFPGVHFILKRYFTVDDKTLERNLFSLHFKNPVGIAAGFDKEAEVFDSLDAFGFGFVEVGTLTPRAQSGNPKPRLFRLKKDQALINRMGFNNKGVQKAIKQLRNRKTKMVIGGNIGKNKITANENAIQDYLECFRALQPYVDYIAINISSPNTPGLRNLQEKKPLKDLLDSIMLQNNKLNNPKPVLLKIAPDLTKGQLDDIIDIVKETGVHGLIATNTTISREGLSYQGGYIESIGTGGLSGRPLRDRSTEIIRYISSKSAGSIPIIASGGIFNAADAIEKLNAGASLVQVYTGFIYEGPSIAKKINKGLMNC